MRVMTDAELELEEDREEVDVHALAQREMACSTPAEIAPNRPPKTEPLELEEDEEEVFEDSTGEGDLSGDGRRPR